MQIKAKSSKTILPSIVVAGLVIGIVYYAHKQSLSSPLPASSTPVSETTPSVPLPAPQPEISYHSITLTSSKPGPELVAAVGQEHLAAVLSLNRLDIKHLQKDQLIVVPSSYDEPFSLSSFPRQIPDLASVPKIMMVDQRIQEFAVYQNGTLIRFGAVSTGKKSTPTPSKLYYTNWKGKLVTSTVDDEWIMPWYFNLDNIEGVSMHQFDLPGYPASHSCVRLSEEDAMWLYDFADQWKLSPGGSTVVQKGTPVLVFNSYAYGETAPWKKLPEDKYTMTLSVNDISKVLEPVLSEITPNTSALQPSLPQ